MPVLIIRNIIGFRELENKTKKGFSLSPSVPNDLFITGRTYGISKINFQELNFSISYTIGGSNAIEVEIKFSKNIQDKIVLEYENGNELSLLQNDDTIKIKVENFQSFNVYLYLLDKISQSFTTQNSGWVYPFLSYGSFPFTSVMPL
mgnify:CR=1 FL=1